MATILVVDDQILCRRALRATLGAAGHEVREARNGYEAIECCLQAVPDAVLLDVFMPEKDGVETLLHLRQILPALPVVMISDGGKFRFEPLFSMVGMLGATAVLRKPFNQDELFSCLALIVASAAVRPAP